MVLLTHQIIYLASRPSWISREPQTLSNAEYSLPLSKGWQERGSIHSLLTRLLVLNSWANYRGTFPDQQKADLNLGQSLINGVASQRTIESYIKRFTTTFTKCKDSKWKFCHPNIQSENNKRGCELCPL